MAHQVTITLDDESYAELEKLRDEHNVGFPQSQLTIAQQARDILRDHLGISAGRRVEETHRQWRSVYEAASPTDRAIMDAVRNRIRIQPAKVPAKKKVRKKK